MPTNTYDLIVFGDDLAGVVAAALCAHRGMRVLLAETAQTPAERYTLGSWSLPRAPLPFPFEASPAIRRVVAELNFIQTLKRRMVPLRPAFQVVMPDARFDVNAADDAFGHELDREFPGERPAVAEILARAEAIAGALEPVLGQDIALPPDGFWERRELKLTEARLAAAAGPDPLAPLPAEHPLRAVFALPAAFTLATDPRATPPLAALRCFHQWRRGAARLEGDRDALRQLFVEKLRTQHAGEVTRVNPREVLRRWGRAHALSLGDRAEILGTRAFLSAAPVAELGDLFGERWPKRLRHLAKGLAPTAYRAVLHLVASAAVVPEALAPVCFVLADPGAPLVGDNAFAIYTGLADDDGNVLISVVANAPAPGDGENLDDVLLALWKKILRRLTDVVPFLKPHLLVVHSPHDPRPPEGLATHGALPLMPPQPLWTSSLPWTLGVGTVPYAVGVRGLTAAGAQTAPGLGLEGEFLAGWCAARRVCAALGKKRDYLKDEVLVGA